MVSIKDELASPLHELVSQVERTFPYASALVTRSRALNVRSSSREERIDEVGPTVGAVFTAWNGAFFEEVATGDLTPDGLAAAARELRNRAGTGPKAGLVEIPVADYAPEGCLSYRSPAEIDPDSVSLQEKMDICRKGRGRAASIDSRVVEAQCMYKEEHVESVFVGGRADMSQKISRVSFGFSVIFRDGGVVRFDGESNGGTGGFELAAIEDSQWDAVAARIPGLLRATPIEPGYHDVVVSPTAAGLIAHEAFGHGVEADMFLKGRAKSREYLGKAVGSGLVNLFDDPTYPGGFGTCAFDDEGQPASKTQILRNGVFVQGLTDLSSAMRLGLPRTSNGRREAVNKAYPRMTNTYFGAGDDRLEDMIAGIDRGYYLGQTLSGMEDPKDWGVQCIIAWARAIQHGRLTDKFHTQVGLTGYVPDLLGSIRMVGRDLKLYGGTCGKGHKEMIRVGMGGPHLTMRARLG